MRHAILKMGLGLTLGLALAGCELTDIKKTEDETAKPATAATVVGTWRGDVPLSATPPTVIKLTLRVDEAGTMVLSQRMATGKPAPHDNVEISKEMGTWKIQNDSLVSLKTECEYKDPATMQTVSSNCATPLTKSLEIKVYGSAWTVLEKGQTVILRKD